MPPSLLDRDRVTNEVIRNEKPCITVGVYRRCFNCWITGNASITVVKRL